MHDLTFQFISRVILNYTLYTLYAFKKNRSEPLFHRGSFLVRPEEKLIQTSLRFEHRG